MAKTKKKRKEKSYDDEIDELIHDVGTALRKESEARVDRNAKEYPLRKKERDDA